MARTARNRRRSSQGQPARPGIEAALGAFQRGYVAETAEICSRILSTRPRNGDAMHLLGAAYLALNQPADAVETLTKAARIERDNPEVHANLGAALRGAGFPDRAAKSLRRALALNPNSLAALFDLGNTLNDLGRPQEAAKIFRKALAIDPGSTRVMNNLGATLTALGDAEQAVEILDRAAGLEPGNAAIHNNLASALLALDRDDEALSRIGRALQLQPDHADGLNNLAFVHRKHGRLEQAIETYGRAIEAEPAHRNALYGRAFANLLLGRYETGWRDYLARPATAATAHEFDRQPLAGDLAGRHLCVSHDQGLGDELFFLRFAPQLTARGARITYRADRRLAAMLQRAGIADTVTGGGEMPERADLRLAVGDLPWLLGMTDGDAPPAPFIIPALDDQVKSMRGQLNSFGPGPYIGITWRGGTRDKRGTLSKEVPLAGIAAALAPTSGTLIALQRNPDEDEIAALSRLAGRQAHDLTGLNDDLEAMLALLGLLDDYICVSNTNVHLRVARGGTCRVLLPHPPEFRWMAGGDETPWFPGTRVYRQGAGGDWQQALAELGADLADQRKRD